MTFLTNPPHLPPPPHHQRHTHTVPSDVGRCDSLSSPTVALDTVQAEETIDLERLFSSSSTMSMFDDDDQETGKLNSRFARVLMSGSTHILFLLRTL